MLVLQHVHNLCTPPPRMRVGPTHWITPSYEGKSALIVHSCSAAINSQSDKPPSHKPEPPTETVSLKLNPWSLSNHHRQTRPQRPLGRLSDHRRTWQYGSPRPLTDTGVDLCFLVRSLKPTPMCVALRNPAGHWCAWVWVENGALRWSLSPYRNPTATLTELGREPVETGSGSGNQRNPLVSCLEAEKVWEKLRFMTENPKHLLDSVFESSQRPSKIVKTVVEELNNDDFPTKTSTVVGVWVRIARTSIVF